MNFVGAGLQFRAHLEVLPETFTNISLGSGQYAVSLFMKYRPLTDFVFLYTAPPVERYVVQAADSATLLCKLSARAARGTDVSLHRLIPQM